MKKHICISLLTFCLFFSYGQLKAQNFPKMDVSPMDAAAYPSDYKKSIKDIKIVYSRPQLKGRSLSKLAPNGEVWRTGANEACELTLYKDMRVGRKIVKAGTYTFYTIPGETEWTAVINSDLNVWGAYFYDESKDVARIKVPVTTSKESLEPFSIAFEGTEDSILMQLGWGNVRIAVPFQKM